MRQFIIAILHRSKRHFSNAVRIMGTLTTTTQRKSMIFSKNEVTSFHEGILIGTYLFPEVSIRQFPET